VPRGYVTSMTNLMKRGHTCWNKKTQLFLVEIPRECNEADEGYDGPEGDGEPIGFEMLETDPCISLQAVNGMQGYQTMRITGTMGISLYKYW